MKKLAIIIRFLLGVVFVYSGFVKAVDPWGFQFKLEDYFIAFGWDWLNPAALTFSILLSMGEFLIGVAFLLGIKPKLSAWSALIFMLIFTPITLYLAITNAVADCGCFGDALILTNWETFYKNIVLLVLVLFIFWYRNKFGHYMKCAAEWVPVCLFAIGIVGISFYGLRHLPMIDFLPYKAGLSMKPDPSQKDLYFVSYKDKTTQKVTEYPADNYPWSDSIWMANNEFVSQRVQKGSAPQHLVYVSDSEGENQTEMVMLNPDFQLIVVAYDLENVSENAFSTIKTSVAECEKQELSVVGLTATTPEKTELIRHDKQLALPFYFADDIVLKMFIRCNPGFILMKDGSILGKWAWRDIPEISKINFAELETKYLKSAK